MKRFSQMLDGLEVGLFSFPLSLCYTLPMCQTNNMHNIIVYRILFATHTQYHRNAKMNSSTRFEMFVCAWTKQTPCVAFFVFQGRKKALKRIKPSTLCSRFCLYIWRYIFFFVRLCFWWCWHTNSISFCLSFPLSPFSISIFFFASEREDNRVIERKRANEQQSRRQIKYICMWLWL